MEKIEQEELPAWYTYGSQNVDRFQASNGLSISASDALRYLHGSEYSSYRKQRETKIFGLKLVNDAERERRLAAAREYVEKAELQMAQDRQHDNSIRDQADLNFTHQMAGVSEEFADSPNLNGNQAVLIAFSREVSELQREISKSGGRKQRDLQLQLDHLLKTRGPKAINTTDMFFD